MDHLNLKLGFVFTNYNNSKVTWDAIKSLSLLKSFNDILIVVVDNNSDRLNVELLIKIKQEFSNVEIIQNCENLGYFRGLNYGIKFLRKICCDIDLLVIGNNDLIFPASFIDSLLKNRDLYEFHPVISPNIITMDGVHQNPHVINGITKFREVIFDIYYYNYFLAKLIKYISEFTNFFTDRRDEREHEVARPISQGYGACYILTPLFFRNFEELWAPTFLMGEEFFLSKQLESKNFKVYYEPSIVVNHQCHAAMAKIPMKSIWRFGKDSHKEYRKYVSVYN